MRAHTSLAFSVSAQRIKQARETGAKMLITACPTCAQMLEMASKKTKDRIQVVDIAKLVLDALKKMIVLLLYSKGCTEYVCADTQHFTWLT